MYNYLKKIKYFNIITNSIGGLRVNAIDQIKNISLIKDFSYFLVGGLLCFVFVNITFQAYSRNHNHYLQPASSISMSSQNTIEPEGDKTDVLSAEYGDGQANNDISMVTRGNEFVELRNGSEGEQVEKVQQALTDKGLYEGPINSKFGPITEAAVILFQKKNGFDGNGIIDERQFNLICTPSAVEIASSGNQGLKNGSEGEEVKKLQQKLTDKKFYSGPINGKFGPLTETAVKAFQKKVAIDINGIVTKNVMDKLNAYKLPVNASSTSQSQSSAAIKKTTSSVKPAANGVELLDWSVVKSIFAIGLTASVYDVRSGLTYKVKSFSNGSHADVEPVTAEDTAIMLKTYNGKWKWDPRPVWVTVNGRILAGSINGMPHGGDTNPNNNMNGQICIHFRGSTTHNGNKSFAKAHQDALTEAWNATK